MPLPSDPLLSTQWHLIQPVAGLLDLNVAGVWNPGQGPAYTGAGTRTVVIDDGVDYRHADLVANYDQTIDFNFETGVLDALGGVSDSHGTAVAGIIGAAANGSGVVGLAFETALVGYRTAGLISDFWLGNIRDAIHSAAMDAQADVANISLGIANDFFSVFRSGYDPLLFAAVETSIGTAVDQGRFGLGMTIVKSAGNSRADTYDVNADDWTNDTRQVVVAAVDQNGFVSDYSSYGAAVLVSAFGTPGEVVTTDRIGAEGYNAGNFASDFNGTSSAAPMVAGVVALVYDAAPGLGWRDVQTILASSARHVGSEVGNSPAGFEIFEWGFNAARTWNGGGQHFSNDYGYGLVDARAAVRLAESWALTGTAAATSANQAVTTLDVLDGSRNIPDGNITGLSFGGTTAAQMTVERVTVEMAFSTTYVGDLRVYLISPGGTVSEVVADVGFDTAFDGRWTFESQAFRGEQGAGTWTVQVIDSAAGDVLRVTDLVIRTFGSTGVDDRQILTDEFSDYAGVAGHATTIVDSNGGTDTVNAAAVTSASDIRLNGQSGSVDGVAVTFTNFEHAIGGDAGDTLIGNASANMLFGMRGADRLEGRGGADTLVGGTGADTAVFGQMSTAATFVLDADGNVVVTLADGTDLLEGVETLEFQDRVVQVQSLLASGTGGNDNLRGSSANDLLAAFGGADRLDGRGGDDTLNGGDGGDTLNGGTGDDFIFGGATAADLRDVAFGGDGRDSIDGGAGNDELNGGNGNDTVLGGAGADTLVGNADSDVLGGGAGGDLMSGNAGNDTLNGGFGFDRMNGGTGADQFFHQGVRDHGSDWIQDYNAAEGDVLAVGIAGATASQFQVNFATTVGAGSAAVQEAFVIYRPTGQVLWALVDGADDTAINLVIGGQVFDLLA